jgi:hypothetical protein
MPFIIHDIEFMSQIGGSLFRVITRDPINAKQKFTIIIAPICPCATS